MNISTVYKIAILALLLCILIIISSFVSRQYIFYKSHKDFLHNTQINFDTPIKKSYKVIIATANKKSTSDLDLSYKLYKASTNLGWEVYQTFSADEYNHKINIISPDFIIFASDKLKEFNPSAHNKYVFLNKPAQYYFGGIFTFTPQFKKNHFFDPEQIDGFISSFDAARLIKTYKTIQSIKSYPTSYKTDYKELEFKDIIYNVLFMDKFKSSNKFQDALTSLSNDININIYCGKNIWQDAPYIYQGKFDVTKFVEIFQKHGIALVLHSKAEDHEEIPSSVVFEAVAASAIVISDKNHFLSKMFGNNILYYDAHATSNEIYQQLKSHISWIKKNFTLAHEKTKTAFTILNTNFPMEKELIKIAKMHEKTKHNIK